MFMTTAFVCEKPINSWSSITCDLLTSMVVKSLTTGLVFCRSFPEFFILVNLFKSFTQFLRFLHHGNLRVLALPPNIGLVSPLRWFSSPKYCSVTEKGDIRYIDLSKSCGVMFFSRTFWTDGL